MSNLNQVSDFAERLNYLFELNKATIGIVSKDTNISKGSLFGYLKGRCKAKQGYLLVLADYFRVSPSWLMGYDVPMRKNTIDTLPANAFEYSVKNFVKVPIAGKIKAGTPVLAEEHIEGYQKINPKFIKRNRTYFCLSVSGNSMYPEFQENDILLIQKAKTFKNGDVCVVMINGDEATLKRVYKDENGIRLVAKNPAYPEKEYTKEEIEQLPVEIAGIVVSLIERIYK